MIIDVHAHIGFDKDGMVQTVEDLVRKMNESKVDYSVVFPLDEKTEDLIGSSLALLNLENPRFIPFLRFDPNTTSPERVCELLPKFNGVKLHTRSQNIDVMDKKYWPIFDEIAKSGKPLLFHTRSGQNPITEPDHVSLIADEFQDMKIIIGHFGEGSKVTAERVKNHENLYLETSIMSLTSVRVNRIYDIVGAEKILFGSDVPYSDQDVEILKIRKSKMSDEDKELVFYKNALKLLNLKGLKPVFWNLN